MKDKTKAEQLVSLDEVLTNLGLGRCEMIELDHQVESMTDRIDQLNLGSNNSKSSRDAIMKVVDKRRYTRERLAEVRVEVQELETQRDRIISCLKWGKDE